jgi:hypothetical protein
MFAQSRPPVGLTIDGCSPALDPLERAIALGRPKSTWLLNDNDFAPLHEHPRFKQIVARLA